jgi:Smg protein
MYDILVYLFEHCQRQELRHDCAHVAKKLSDAGFEESDISEALSWLAGVVRGPDRSLAPLPGARAAARIYAPRELARLDAECRGLIERLEQSAILSPQTREHVIERALAAASGEPLTAAQLRLIVLMVLWNDETPTSRLVAEELLSPAGGRLPS